ncbi:hypothetical protein [Dysgonomonas sp. ZJ279]|uniref:hypothetical protein n=1 Tax=Dysgonomonas sp. ZJ279 TaxID=2709796 RepID=UPI0013EDA7D9|nr:hypothetical protein [Dysgonomonas sp. ZJ279]
MAERISQAEFEHRCKLGATQDVLVDGLGYVYWTSRAGTAIGPWGNKGSGKTRAYILPVVLPKRGMPDLYLDCAKVAIVLPAFLDPDFGARKKESEEKLQELFKKHYTDQSTNKLDEWSYNKIKRRIEEGSISMADEMPLDIKYSDELVNYFDYHTGYDSRKVYASEIKEQEWDWQSRRDEYLAGEGRNMLMSSVLPSLNMIGGVGVSIAKMTTLAGQGKYITSKGLVREISTLSKLTKHAQPYAQTGRFIRYGGYFSLFAGGYLDYVAYDNNEISGAKVAANSGVTVAGLVIGALVSGWVALTLSVGYFGIDQYYPGGWEGYGKDEMERNRTRPYAGPKY